MNGVHCLLKVVSSNTISKNCLYTINRTFAFKSALSLDKLYPKSSLKLTTPQFVPEEPGEKFNGFIPISDLDISYCRSSGPGGQSVNTTNSKVNLRFHVKSAAWLHDDLKEKLIAKHYTRINKDGYLILKSELTRSQHLNLAHALDKLRSMIRELDTPPKEVSPEAEERRRKLLLKAARERVHEKRMNAMKKESRKRL